ncbi:MAG: AAA family ATPase [Flavobacteriales bacterium]|nr:AAA family ATPase [Flavobacteriales bacterium]
MKWQFPYYNIGKPVEWDILEQKFSWIQDMRDVPQDPIWHAEGDVLTHTKMVVDALIELPEFQSLEEQEKHILFASALMHDIEKRSTTTTEIINGLERIVSPKHAKKGEFTVRNVLYKDIPTPFRIREHICKLVRLHGLPLWAIQKEDPKKNVISASLALNTKLLAMLAKADVMGRICQDKEDILLRIELFSELCKENNCWGQPYEFRSNYGRFYYLNRKNAAPDYQPYDDLKFDVDMMVAIPGSGKDTYIKNHLKNTPMLSLDALRRELKIDPTDKKMNGKVVSEMKELIKQKMRKRESFVFNATNITGDMRSKWISLFVSYGARVRLIYVEVPYSQLLKQNKQREYVVPEKVINRLVSKLEIPGFDEAHEIIFEVPD